MKSLIIAEVGVNHNGDIDLARELIRSAKATGADIVKFQSFKSEKLLTVTAEKANYQKNNTGQNGTQYEMLQKLELTQNDHEVIVDECRNQGIGFLSTAFDTESFDMLVQLGIKYVKISSGELTNVPLLRHITRLGLPVILSTGMANLSEVEFALGVIERAGTPRALCTVLQCTTEYPTPMSDVNLLAMVKMGALLCVEIGCSDHTPGIEVPIAAVALGAKIIEKHFTLNRNLPGPDHKASLEFDEFRAMVRAIRNIENAFGDGVKRPSKSELENITIARRSIVATCHISAGQIFSNANISTKRPGNGLSPVHWDKVIGKPAKRDFATNEFIEL